MNVKKKVFSFLLLVALLLSGSLLTMLTARQLSGNPALTIYRETPARINDLIHTKLEVRFDYKKRYLNGKEWVTLKPHFYPTDSLRLDAKGMNINDIALIKNGKKIKLKFSYDTLSLNIKLDKTYQEKETYTIFIDYTAKPNELKNARNDGRGLYFINPDGTEKDKPTQIWTQGETEYNSVWFPTIDKTNQKTTQEIAMTVPAKYVTLSNGLLVTKKINTDGTRTDTWKMDLPHAPYLFMMAVGDFKIYKDNWKGKEVSYYLEPKYAPYSKAVFGFTTEAMEFFSKTLGVDFPWPKYSQIRVRDYVSGAMENTSAAVYGEDGKITKRELADRDFYESGAVHELFHQWFGDYVTTESWSNLTLNESFANLGEILWAEFKLGKDVADEHFFGWVNGYLGNSDDWQKPLVRYHYEQEQDLFDGVTFSKGACILNMLRNYLGNDAFYAGLRNYLQKNAFKAAEAHQLRLAMEEVSGRDLNWFFNQWYFNPGHPVLDIQYKWNDDTKTQSVYLKQIQEGNVFTLPFAIDIYIKGKTERYTIWMHNKSDSFHFQVTTKPDLVNVDADKILLAKKTDSKNINDYQFQYANAPLYADRYEAIEAAIEKQTEIAGQKIFLSALSDKFYGLRSKAINALNMTIPAIRNAATPILILLAQNDKNNLVRADAITALGNLKDSGNANLLRQTLKSDSYAVQAASLNAFAQLNPTEALSIAKGLEENSKGNLTRAIIDVYGTYGNDEQWPYVYHQFTDANSSLKYSFTFKFAEFTGRVPNPAYAQQGVEAIKTLITEMKLFHLSERIIERLNEIKMQQQTLNDNATCAVIDKAIIEIKAAK